MIVEYVKKTRKTIHLPTDPIEIGEETFTLREHEEPNKLTVCCGAWETTFTINNPEEFARKPVEQVFAMVKAVYDDLHEYLMSTLGDVDGTV